MEDVTKLKSNYSQKIWKSWRYFLNKEKRRCVKDHNVCYFVLHYSSHLFEEIRRCMTIAAMIIIMMIMMISFLLIFWWFFHFFGDEFLLLVIFTRTFLLCLLVDSTRTYCQTNNFTIWIGSIRETRSLSFLYKSRKQRIILD